MVTIGMNYQVQAGKEQVFEDACNKVIDVMGKDEGHAESRLFRETGGSSVYLIVSRWQSEDAFKAFIASEQFKKVTSWGLANILAGRPTHTTYHENAN